MLDGYTITFQDPRHFTDDAVAEGVALGNLLRHERMPDEPPTPVDQAIAAHRAVPDRIRRWSYRVRDGDGTLVASGNTALDPEHDDNPHLLQLRIHVHPDHRRQGLGTALLAELARVARQEGRTVLLSDTSERVPAGEAFARAVGSSPKMAAHLNHLPVGEIDRPMLEQWVAEGPMRAPHYEVFGFDGPVPEDLLDAFVELFLVMNTAPRDDLEIEDFTLTPSRWREQEQQMDAAGYEHWTLVARHRETGELAGFHDVYCDPTNPTVMHVGATGVQPAHRGHALGKWLKAAMTLRILHERPEITDIRTGNADSNDAMLGINQRMGYRPLMAETLWTVTLADVERWLDDHRTSSPAAPVA